jgi:hypothetical protein
LECLVIKRGGLGQIALTIPGKSYLHSANN